MSILLRVACPSCGHSHDSAALGVEIRCQRCGEDFRAIGDGEGASRVLSVTPDNLDDIPYSQRSIEVPVNPISNVILADPTLLDDKLLRELPVRQNTKWVGKVRLVKKLGQGGMGAVYRGYDEGLALDVAVKILPMPLGERDHQFIERFRQEARISAQINHPNVVRTLHVDEQNDVLYLVMDYVEGQTARKLVDSRGPLPLPLALQIIHDASKGMQAAHDRGVIHRDIKPENILVADDGRVLLADLGLAKAAGNGGAGTRMPVTRMGMLLGTPEYMSPEQWDIYGVVGPTSDIWAMGATLWYLLTRRPLFDNRDTGALARAIKDAPTPDIHEIRENVPVGVARIIERCLAKEPAQRFQSGTLLMAAIAEAQDELANARGGPKLPAAVEKLQRAQPPAPRPVLDAIRPDVPAVPLPAANVTFAPPTPTPQPAPVSRATPVPATPRWALFSLAGAAALALAALLWVVLSKETNIESAAGAPLAMDLRCPARVKPGDEARLAVEISGGAGAAAYEVYWQGAGQTLTGAAVSARLDHDTEFEVVVREAGGGREVLRRTVRIEAELQVDAAERELLTVESGSPLRLAGRVRGGASAEAVELRWVEPERPNVPLATGSALELPANEMQPGRRTLILQARRAGSSDWRAAATDSVVIEVTQQVPPLYKSAMTQGAEARQKALDAATGDEALVHWRAAAAAFDRADSVFPQGAARAEADAARQRAAQEKNYVAMLEEARKLRDVAESMPVSEGTRRLAAWTAPLRAYSAVLAISDRAEARVELDAVEEKVRGLTAALEKAEQERAEFDGIIVRARRSAKEGRKYVDNADALPHWEEAAELFETLLRRFPRRADEFALELKDVQESRDRAYLAETFGVVPERPLDEAPERPRRNAPEIIDTPAPPTPPAPRNTPNEPRLERIPEPFRPADPRPSSR